MRAALTVYYILWRHLAIDSCARFRWWRYCQQTYELFIIFLVSFVACKSISWRVIGDGHWYSRFDFYTCCAILLYLFHMQYAIFTSYYACNLHSLTKGFPHSERIYVGFFFLWRGVTVKDACANVCTFNTITEVAVWYESAFTPFVDDPWKNAWAVVWGSWAISCPSSELERRSDEHRKCLVCS